MKRKELKKNIIIKLLIIITTLFMTKERVSADTNTDTLVRNTRNDIYSIAPLSDKTHLYNLELYEINGIPTYCIELGKKVLTTSYNYTIAEIEQLNITKLSKEKLEYIKLVAYYGYKYEDKYEKHNDIKYYMATQEMIWEYLNNINITWTNELNINGPTIDIETYKNNIKNLIKKHKLGLSFSSDVSCKIGEKITLYNDNNNLYLYQMKNNGNQVVSIYSDQNRVEIQTRKDSIGKKTIMFETKNQSGNLSKIYYSNGSQTLVSRGKSEGEIVTVNLNIQGETLITNIIDKDTKTNIPSGQATLIGAEYELYDKNNNLITKFTTNKTGINKIENLYYDKYYIKQVKPSQGYQKDDKLIEINLSNANNKITLEEEVIKSNIEINKLYEVNNEYKKEENIIFNIYDNNDILYNSITTTKTGPDIFVLPYGKYTIKQVNTTEGYYKVDDIKLNIDENSGKNIIYNLVDKKIIKEENKKGKKKENIKKNLSNNEKNNEGKEMEETIKIPNTLKNKNYSNISLLIIVLISLGVLYKKVNNTINY